MKSKWNKNKWILLIITATVLTAWLFQIRGMKTYARYNTDAISYDRGKVVEVLKEELEYDEKLKVEIGTQEINVKLKEGKHQGEMITVTNYITKTHQIKVKKNDAVIINVDQPESLQPYYTVYNYDRFVPLMISLLILLFAIILVGKRKGVMAIAGLAYTMFLVIGLLLPMVFSGYSPIFVSIGCAVLSTAVTLLLLNGQSRKTLAAIVSTVGGICISLVFFLVISYLLHLDGFSVSEAEGLILIGEVTGLQVKEVLFAGILISSLGAIMDVGMSIVSALYEIHYHNPTLRRKEIFHSGIEIGKDMIGTMSNTLILAFTGSSLITLLVFISYQVELNQLLNSNYLTLEIAQGICGTLGIVATVPIASFVTAFILCKKRETVRLPGK